MNFISRIFKRKIFRCNGQRYREPKPLCVQNCKTSLTPAPDDAEFAAQALLEAHTDKSKKTRKRKDTKDPARGTPEYYKQLAERIKKAKAAEVRRAKRFLTYAEQQLDSPLMTGQTGEIERELYKLQDVAEREGGELLKRWQHCLAECIVRQMSGKEDGQEDTDLTDGADEHQPSDI
jgi:hypothetical protein